MINAQNMSNFLLIYQTEAQFRLTNPILLKPDKLQHDHSKEIIRPVNTTELSKNI